MKKRALSLALAFIMIIMFVPLTASAADSPQFSGGTGTEDDPYIITTAEQLALLAEHVNARDDDPENIPDGGYGDMTKYAFKAYKLGNDIDISGYGKNWNGGNGWVPIGSSNFSFWGSFDGNNHKITGLYINAVSDRVGLFGFVERSGTVKNLGVIDANVSSGFEEFGSSVGVIAARCDGLVTNCDTTGTVKGKYNVSALVGEVNGGSILDCHSTCDVTGTIAVGGIVGSLYGSGGSVTDSYSAGVVNGENAVGGVAGDVSSSIVANCYSACEVRGTYHTGGVVGRVIDGSIVASCYSTGSVYCEGNKEYGRGGGVVGWLGRMTEGGGGSVINCYSTGSISGGLDIGGVVGIAMQDSKISNCYSTGTISGKGAVGGVTSGAFYQSSVVDCAALNSSVNGTVADYVGRVVGFIDSDSSISGNRALQGMNTNAGAGSAGGRDTLDGYDGAEITVKQALTTATWNGWDKDVWLIEDGKLPVLKNMPGTETQVVTLSEPVKEAPNLDTAASWARDGIKSAVNKGFVPVEIQSSYSSIITRADFCRMAVKFVEYKTGKSIDAVLADSGVSRRSDAFSDTNDGYILAAYALGIISGTKVPTATAPGTFTPNGEFSREQAATMIRNTCKVIGMDVSDTSDQGFSDINTASVWAHDSINFVRASGIMSGTSTNASVFSPKKTYTRQESIVTFDGIK